MQHPATFESVSAKVDSSQAARDKLRDMVEHAAHFLPAQGPITVFIHHNTLHAFEDLPFSTGLQKGARLFGCQPYLAEERYRQELARKRIQTVDLLAVLRAELQDRSEESVAGLTSRIELRCAMLEHPLRVAPAAEFRWFMAETDALARYRADASETTRQQFLAETRHWVMRDAAPEAAQDPRRHGALNELFERFNSQKIEHWSESTWEAFSLQALWRICREGVHALPVNRPAAATPARHRDVLLEATGEDSDRLANELLVRFCGAFLDQGFSVWQLPHRDEGFLKSFCAVYGNSWGPPTVWMKPLVGELARLTAAGSDPVDSILESLNQLGVAPDAQEDYITATLLALPGWAGMIWQMETRADRAAHPAPAGSLLEFLAIRLILDRLALAHIARESLSYSGPLHRLRQAARDRISKPEMNLVEQRAFQVFQLAQLLGWTPPVLAALNKSEWATLVQEIESFAGMERRRVFQEAYERRYRVQTLDAVGTANQTQAASPPKAKFQTVHCLDEREESFRRYIEEIAPHAETLGTAGFFNVAMYYRGAADANFVPLCPIVERPKHWVVETVIQPHAETHRRRAATRRVLGTASHHVHVGSRSFAGGALLAGAVGVLASVPLVARVLFPRLTARIRKRAARLIQPPTSTRLQLERDAGASHDDGDIGYTIDEMVTAAAGFLRGTGFMRDFARIVVIIGHGSNSFNNPHNSAYNCGACGGGAGGPNARAISAILNDPRVRALLAERGLEIPDETIFIGAFHNTCDDSLPLFDLEQIPATHREEFEEVRRVLEEACERNAHERCRRFQSAPLTMSVSAAKRHVEARSQDLAQTRPECGHASNAWCLVGRRSRTRGLYMDRRAYLSSYDPYADDAEYSDLAAILGAVIPVCAGISLEYFFSYMDPTGWGSGTKLPHNVAALLGVMDGPASDLRTGLPWQMVEIHEPLRCLFVIEAKPAALLKIMDRSPAMRQLCDNKWIFLATLDPESSRIDRYVDGQFEEYQPETTSLPVVSGSIDWYRGWRDNLGYAKIDANHKTANHSPVKGHHA